MSGGALFKMHAGADPDVKPHVCAQEVIVQEVRAMPAPPPKVEKPAPKPAPKPQAAPPPPPP
jgi:hypothetical protein